MFSRRRWIIRQRCCRRWIRYRIIHCWLERRDIRNRRQISLLHPLDSGGRRLVGGGHFYCRIEAGSTWMGEQPQIDHPAAECGQKKNRAEFKEAYHGRAQYLRYSIRSPYIIQVNADQKVMGQYAFFLSSPRRRESMLIPLRNISMLLLRFGMGPCLRGDDDRVKLTHYRPKEHFDSFCGNVYVKAS